MFVLVNAQCEVCACKSLYKVLAGRSVCFLDVTVIVFEYQCTRWLNQMAVPTPKEGILSSIFFSMIYQKLN